MKKKKQTIKFSFCLKKYLFATSPSFLINMLVVNFERLIVVNKNIIQEF